MAFSQSNNLQNPSFKILLVRLNTNMTQINALKQRGFYKQADQRTQALQKKNEKLRKAFAFFSHCPVYFFNSQYTDSILFSKQKDAFLFTMDSLPIKDTSHIRQIQANAYIIGQLGSLKSTELNLPCFYLSNHQGKVLQKPFKYYVRSHFFSIPIAYKRMVEKLEKNLSKKDKI